MVKRRKKSKVEDYDWDELSISSFRNRKNSERMSLFLTRVFVMTVFIAVFFLLALFIQLAWNYTLPKLVDSIQKDYDPSTDFKDIDYWTAVVLTLLVSFLFGGMWKSSTCSNPCCR